MDKATCGKLALVLTAGLFLARCTPKQEPLVPPDYADLEGKPAERAAKSEFGQALTALSRHDRQNDWTDASCKKTARQFLLAAELMKRVEKKRTEHLSARYNAALSYQRCSMSADAKKVLTSLLDDEPGFHRAAAQLAMYRFQESGDVDVAIGELSQIVTDSKFKNVDALVDLASLLMRRGSDAVDENGHDDWARARLNLQRALAVDDGNMSALNQLAILYLRQAGGQDAALQIAGTSTKAADKSHATLELAALICSQAMRKDPNYAPIHNTAGLVHARLGDLSAAAKSFARARQLNSGFFEAHMNYAAVNLQFRGFKNAQKAYEKALEIQPKSYDALLGLSLALRGQIGDAQEGMRMLNRAEKLLAKAKVVNGERPEAWFNEAILLQEFRAPGLPQDKMRKVLLSAKAQFGEFLRRADKHAFADARVRAQERIRDIDEMLKFMP